VPIKSITSRSQNDKITYLSGEEPGPVCVKLLTTLKGVQQGKVEDKWGWLDHVKEPQGYQQKGQQNGVNGQSRPQMD
jgi:branched-chain amino acid aminotransferase